MTGNEDGHGRTVLWTPPADNRQGARMLDFMSWVGRHRGTSLADYRETLTWSVTELSDFWDALREYFDVLGTGFTGPALTQEQMPGAVWYPAARLNYAHNLLRHATDPDLADTTAIVEMDEDGKSREVSWSALSGQVSSVAEGLRRLGVQQGDVVAAVLPNIPEAIVGLLASASIGAVWCICSP
ncbi:MAG: AMP-binding protein, partial [Actinomycetota bacterium]|nr:AMP-binding protein [Actinomycetota bacterium]